MNGIHIYIYSLKKKVCWCNQSRNQFFSLKGLLNLLVWLLETKASSVTLAFNKLLHILWNVPSLAHLHQQEMSKNWLLLMGKKWGAPKHHSNEMPKKNRENMKKNIRRAPNNIFVGGLAMHAAICAKHQILSSSLPRSSAHCEGIALHQTQQDLDGRGGSTKSKPFDWVLESSHLTFPKNGSWS